MQMRCLAGLVLSLVTAIALAQTPPERDGAQRRGWGPPPGGSPDGGPRGWGGRGGMMFGPGRMFGRIPEQLSLDEDQKAKFDELMQAHGERMRAFGERMQEARQAAESGDAEAGERLRNEFRERDIPGESLSQVFDELGESLNEDQLDKLDEIRDDMETRQRQMRQAMQMREELPQKLNMDETQQGQFEEILGARREQMRERMAEMRPVFEELRTARENGDDARAAELEKQLEASQPDFGAMQSELLDQVATILNEDQKQLLANYREEASSTPKAGKAAGPDVKTILKALRRVKLVSEQREKVREIEREAQRESRSVSSRDSEAQMMLASKTKAKIDALLDPGQKKDFEKALQRAGGAKRR